jgi:hypothetical protein
MPNTDSIHLLFSEELEYDSVPFLKVGINFANIRRSLGWYSSLAD